MPVIDPEVTKAFHLFNKAVEEAVTKEADIMAYYGPGRQIESTISIYEATDGNIGFYAHVSVIRSKFGDVECSFGPVLTDNEGNPVTNTDDLNGELIAKILSEIRGEIDESRNSKWYLPKP